MAKKTDIDDNLVRKLADLLNETGLTEIEYSVDGFSIRVANNTQTIVAAPAGASINAPASLTAPPPADENEDPASHPGTITSPMVGVAYVSSDPSSPPFVKVGDQVSEGQTLLLIEAMKVFNPIVAPKAGQVSQIFVDNGSPVEFGAPLIILE